MLFAPMSGEEISNQSRNKQPEAPCTLTESKAARVLSVGYLMSCTLVESSLNGIQAIPHSQWSEAMAKAKTKKVRRVATPAADSEKKKKRSVRKDTMEGVERIVNMVLGVAEGYAGIPSHVNDDMSGLKRTLSAIQKVEKQCHEAQRLVDGLRAPTFKVALANSLERYAALLRERWDECLGDPDDE